MRGRTIIVVLLFVTVISLFVVRYSIHSTDAYTAYMLVLNPITDTASFTYAMGDVSVGTNININLTIWAVSDLHSWQARMNWDPMLLEFVSLTFPSDDVFFDRNPIRLPTDASVPGTVLCGSQTGYGAGTFTGFGTLAVLTLKIIQSPSPAFPVLTCQVQYTNIGTDTLLLDSNSLPIPETLINAVYTYSFVQPQRPSLGIVPSLIEPIRIGDVFAVNITISNLDARWEVVRFNFSIAWNTTLIGLDGYPFITEGTFLEKFEYWPMGESYYYNANQHDRLPNQTQLPSDYNYTNVMAVLWPDPSPFFGVYHPPFPSGNGTLCTLYFRAIHHSLWPREVFSQIDFVAEDVLFLNSLNESMGYSSLNGAVYRDPISYLCNDIAVSNVTAEKTVAGTLSNISAQISGYGSLGTREEFNVTALANETVIGTQEISLEMWNVTTVTFVWNSTGLAYGNYSIKVCAWPNINETQAQEYWMNNNFTCPYTVHVGVLGDVSGPAAGVYDGTTNMRDINYMILRFNSKPDSSNWNPNADVNNDLVCNMRDIQIAILNFNQHE